MMRISNPMELNIGDVFYECAYGVNHKMIVTSSPTFNSNQLKWKARDSAGNEVEYLITKGCEHYGPRIYTEPAYLGVSL